MSDSTTGAVVLDDSAADYIVNNYLTLYNKYLLYMDSAMTGSDSLQVLAIANLCAYLNGDAVFQARAFYRILYEDDTTVFSDTCVTDTTGIGGRPAIKAFSNADNQEYLLFPNPNNGTFTIKQKIEEDIPVKIEVRDILGKTVYNGLVTFNSASAQLRLNQLSQGVYFMQIRDHKGNIQACKFVIQ